MMNYPQFFFRKFKEVRSFLKIVQGDFTGNYRKKLEGIDQALKTLHEEKKTYKKELMAAKKQVEENRDTTAI